MNILKKIKNIESPFILKSRYKHELVKYENRGFNRALKIKDEEIEELKKDHKNELYIQHQEDMAENEILKQENSDLKQYIRSSRNQRRITKKNTKQLKIINSKFTANVIKVRDIISDFSGTFSGFNDELERIDNE